METGNPVNPFIKSIKAPFNPFSFLAGRDPAGANNPPAEQRNVFRPPATHQQQPENNPNAIIPSANTRDVRSLFQKPSTDPPRQQARNAGHSTANDSVQLKVQINGQACEINKTTQKQVDAFADLGWENMAVVMPRQEAIGLSIKLKITEHIIDCLGALYQRIRDNNLSILQYLKKIPIKNGRDLSAIRLRKDQHARLLKGLFFYRKGNSNALKVLMTCIGEHPLGKAVMLVAAEFDLDALVAYYVVRSVHESKGLLPANATSFFIRNVEVLPETEVLKLSEEFIRQDKLNLLSCYLQIMKGHLPSAFRLLSQREELDILWGNLSNFEKEYYKTKQFVVFIFLRYWQLCDLRLKAPGTELAHMRQKILAMKISQTDRIRLVEIGINDALNQDLGELKESDFSGPFKELFDFFLQNKRDVNCQEALQHLQRVQLSSAWQRHIQSSLQRLLNAKETMNLEQYLYINKVLTKLKAKSIHFPHQLREKLFLRVKQCSLALGIIYLQDACSDIYSASLINLLFGIEERPIRQSFKRDKSYLSKWIYDLSLDKLINIHLSFLKTSIVSFIKSGDIASLQQEIPVTGFYSLNIIRKTYKFLQRYYQFFIKSTMSKMKIQKDINEVFLLLQANKLDIAQSLEQYHRRILKSSKDIQLLSCHIFFLYEIVKDSQDLASFSKSWVQKVDSESLFHDFADFAQIVSMVGQKVLQADKDELLDTFSSVAKLFNHCIKQKFMNKEKLDANALTLYYVMKKVVKWSVMRKLQNEHVQDLCEMVRLMLRKHRDDMKRIVTKQERLNPSIKLFVLLDITTDDDMIQRNYLQIHLSSYPQIKEQLYTRISTDLKGKRDSYVVQAFSLAARHDEQLLHFLIQKNLVDLAQSLKEAPLNSTSISIMLSFGSEISYLIKLRKGGREMQNIVRGILLRILVVYKETIMPPFAFLGLLRICSNSLNRIQYSIHIDLLDRGHKGCLFTEIKRDTDHIYSDYFVYLLCLFVSKEIKKKIDRKGNLPFEVEIFIDIGIMLLQTKEYRSIEVSNFIIKLSHYLDYLTKHKDKCEQISQSVISLQQAIKESKLSETQALTILNNVDKNIDYEELDTEAEPQMENEDLKTEIINFMDKYFKEAEPDKKRHLVKKIIEQMEMMKHTKILLSFIPASEHFKNEKQYPFLLFMSKLVDKVDFMRSPKEVGKFMVKYVNNYSVSMLSANSDDYSKVVKCYIKVINKLVSNSVISALSLLENTTINDQIKTIFIDLRRTINCWPEVPNQGLLKLLHRTQLETQHLPEEWRMPERHSYYGNISMWRLFQFRQKVQFINEILTFSRLMNGLLPKHYLSAFQDLPNFLRFFSENLPVLQDKFSIEKIKTANEILEGGTSNSDDLSLRMMKPISMKQLKYLCGQVVDGLSSLNMEVESQVMEKLGLSKNYDF